MFKKNIGTNLLFSAIFVLLVLIDQLTKKWAVHTLMKEDINLLPGILSFHYLENRGAAWGIFQNAFWLFYVITILVIGLMVYFYARIPFSRKYYYLRSVMILLASGAVGNFIDRAWNHYVVDFIYVEWIRFPVFNIADCYVTVATVLLIHSLTFIYKDDEQLWQRKNGS